MKYFLYILFAFLIGACGDSEKKASEDFVSDNYILKTDENNHTIIKDIRQNLIFVNSKQGCKALHDDNDTPLQDAKDFCENLSFFGFDNWRIPTLQEIRNFSKGMDSEGLVPYFTFAKCKRITGLKSDGTLGAINTHNATPKFEEIPLTLPAGIRCVKEMESF